MRWLRTWWGMILTGLVVILVLLQFVRFFVPAFKLDNPPVTNAVQWDSAQTQQTWATTCGDCHSNETRYPWYSYVAPVGWLVAVDVHEGRQYLNISTGHRVELHEMLETIQEGEMPPQQYFVTHPNAKLTADQRQAFIEGLRATFGK